MCGDSREVLRSLPDSSIDCIITSPPYASKKDYGADGQMGFGQAIEEEYLRDVGTVLHELYRASVPGAALWIVLDTVKSSGKTLLLPWEVMDRARKEGWVLQDLVIWDKGRSLPWSHVGHFRGVFEYILLLSKGALKHFDLDRSRESDHLSFYWVRYPERFNPYGKAPSDLWHFPIPLQGSWSKSYLRHYCPFPLSLVARMIALTTAPGDIVVDPFAGTGSVLAVASHLRRRSLGIEISSAFVRNYAKNSRELLGTARRELGSYGRSHPPLHDSIVRLRMLKFPKSLFAQLARVDRLGPKARQSIAACIVLKEQGKGSVPIGALARIRLILIVNEKSPVKRLKALVANLVRIPPLSKFGLACEVEFVSLASARRASFIGRFRSSRWYAYQNGSFNHFTKSGTPKCLFDQLTRPNGRQTRLPPIFSPILTRIPNPIEE